MMSDPELHSSGPFSNRSDVISNHTDITSRPTLSRHEEDDDDDDIDDPYTLNNISDDVMVYILKFLCPVLSFSNYCEYDSSTHMSLQAWQIPIHAIPGSSLLDSQVWQVKQWPKQALRIALSCARLYHLLFVDPDNDTIFWKWHCLTFVYYIKPMMESDLEYHPYITRPRGDNGQPDFSQCGTVVKDIRFPLPLEIKMGMPSIEQSTEHLQPNFFRTQTAILYQLRDHARKDLQRRETARTKKFNREKFVGKHITPTFLTLTFTSLFINCLLFFILQTLQGFLHWLLVDMLYFDWFLLISNIVQHIAWLPIWVNIILLFALSTSLILHKRFISTSYCGPLDKDLIVVYILKTLIFFSSLTLLLIYLANVLPKRSGDPTWMQPEYIPWIVTVIPLILILAVVFGKLNSRSGIVSSIMQQSTSNYHLAVISLCIYIIELKSPITRVIVKVNLDIFHTPLPGSSHHLLLY